MAEGKGLKGLKRPEDTGLTVVYRDLWVPLGFYSELGLSNYVPVDWRVSGPSCKPTPFCLEGGAPWSLLANGKSAYSGRKAGQAGTSCPWEPADSFTPFQNPISVPERGGGSKGLEYSPFLGNSGRDLAAQADPAERGAPPLPQPPGLYSGSPQREGTAREPCASPFSELQARSPAPSGTPAACPQLRGGAGCPRRPHPRLALAPSI